MDSNQNGPYGGHNQSDPYGQSPDTSSLPQPALTEPEQSQPPQDYVDLSAAYTTLPVVKTHWWNKIGKQEWIALGSVAVLLILAVSGFLLFQHKPAAKPVVANKAATKPAGPQPIVSALTGLPVSAADRQRPITAVMIENSTWARPQSGLAQAGVIYEAIAEAGITRFMALYQEAQPTDIGPIRSVRPYFLQWLQGYDGAISHVGGSPEALRYIKSNKMKDLDQMANGGSYHRITARFAPHNVYTSMANLNKIEQSKGWFTTPNFTGFARKPEAPSKSPTARSIDFHIAADATYNVHYDYDQPTNAYKRSEGGAPHLDTTKQQLAPKVVVAMVVPYSLEADGYHSDYGVLGSGAAVIFQDGTATNATWTKLAVTDPVTFKDATGKTVALNPGQTWISAVSAANAITYKP